MKKVTENKTYPRVKTNKEKQSISVVAISSWKYL